jgi:phosphopantetheinyl transferase (holo-ACP synthase)
MMRTAVPCLAALALALPLRAADPYSVKVQEKAEPPKELAEDVRKLLEPTAVQFLGEKGNVLAEVWFRKEVPAKATDEQIKNGLTYQEVEQTTLLGAVKLHEESADYRKQKLKAGVYTLRLLNQPMDGDHMGTAPYSEFAVLAPAKVDKGEATLETEELNKRSTRASNTGHPAIWLLFPVNAKALNKPPALAKQADNHWVLNVTRAVAVDGKKKGAIGLGLTLIGVSPAA